MPWRLESETYHDLENPMKKKQPLPADESPIEREEDEAPETPTDEPPPVPVRDPPSDDRPRPPLTV
jgi:hypothetical protein